MCKITFRSKYPKKFCGMRCYTTSREFIERVKSQARAASAARILKLTGHPPQPKVEVTCLNCGNKWIANASKKNSKYCNQRCYRQYMAGRFDRWIASPQSLALPQAYDEFMSQNELPCLIDGCGWVGLHLSCHVNFAHGIPADQFKRAAGFNLKTGLVAPSLAQTLSERPHIHEATFGAGSMFDCNRPNQLVRGYRSLEGSEHHAKARAILHATIEMPVRVCRACGAEFKLSPCGWGGLYCSIKCRNRYYLQNRKSIRFWMRCGLCGNNFQGSIDQYKRAEAAQVVFCSTHCRQVNNGRIAGATRHARYVRSQMVEKLPKVTA
jgi:hypothetical protein